jgi:TFIIF-interacting CTD phosphatase-like protein
VIVDNICDSFEMQRDNGIEIRSWYDDNKSDKELIKLSVALDTLL